MCGVYDVCLVCGFTTYILVGFVNAVSRNCFMGVGELVLFSVGDAKAQEGCSSAWSAH